MAVETRNCPKCGAVMDYRLGTYECPCCGHAEDASVLIEPPDTGQNRSRQPWEKPGQGAGSAGTSFTGGPGWAPPPPSDLSRFMSRQGVEPELGVVEHYPTLPTEKRIIIWVIMVPQVFAIIGIFVVMGMFNSMGISSMPPDPELQAMTGVINFLVGLLILQTLAMVAVLYAVLFLEIMPLKWCCGGCSVIAIISILITLFFPSMGELEAMNTGAMRAWQVLAQLLNLGVYVWLLSIIYRDLKDHGRL